MMTRKNASIFAVSVLVSLALAGFAHSTTQEAHTAMASPEPVLAFPVALPDIFASSLVGDASCDIDPYRTSLTIECVDCLVACMESTGQSGFECRIGVCMWPCSD